MILSRPALAALLLSPVLASADRARQEASSMPQFLNARSSATVSTAGDAPVRAGPDPSEPAAARVRKGGAVKATRKRPTPVAVDGEERFWREVVAPTRTMGWMPEPSLRFLPPAGAR